MVAAGADQTGDIINVKVLEALGPDRFLANIAGEVEPKVSALRDLIVPPANGNATM